MTSRTDTRITNYLRKNYGSGIVKYANQKKLKRDFGTTNLYAVRSAVARKLARKRIISQQSATAKTKQLSRLSTRQSFSVVKSKSVTPELRAAVADKIIKDLEASAARTRNARIKEIERQKASLSATPEGRRLLRVYSIASQQAFLKRAKSSPFSKKYKDQIRANIRALKPRQGEIKGEWATVTISGVAFTPVTKREAKYAQALKKTIERDAAYRKDWNNTLKRTGLVVKRGDKWYTKAFKGVAQGSLSFLGYGKFLGNATDKLLVAVAGVGVSRRTRSAIISEAGRAAKETPKAVAKSLDPRKPENWFNIAVIAGLVVAKGFSYKKANVAKATATKALKKVSSAKRYARKATTVKGRRAYKKLVRQEKQLKAFIKKVDKRRSLPSKALKVRSKAGKVKTRTKRVVTTTRVKKRQKLPSDRQRYVTKFRAAKAVKQATAKKPVIVDIDYIASKGGVKPVIKITKPSRSPIRIKKPVFKADSVSVTAGNGQKLLMKVAQKTATKTSVKAATKTLTKGKVKTVSISRQTYKQFRSYTSQLFSLARVGNPFSRIASKLGKAHLLFFPILSSGIVKPSLTVPVAKIAVISRVTGRSAVKTGTASKVAVVQSQIKTVLTQLATAKTTTKIERLVQRYISLKTMLRKINRSARIKFPRFKKKLSKRGKLKLDELYTKVKKKYRPSLAAILFGIYGYKPKVVTGFEIRPLLKKKVKKVAKPRRKKRKKTRK